MHADTLSLSPNLPQTNRIKPYTAGHQTITTYLRRIIQQLCQRVSFVVEHVLCTSPGGQILTCEEAQSYDDQAMRDDFQKFTRKHSLAKSHSLYFCTSIEQDIQNIILKYSIQDTFIEL